MCAGLSGACTREEKRAAFGFSTCLIPGLLVPQKPISKPNPAKPDDSLVTSAAVSASKTFGGYILRQIAAVLLSCALFSAVLLAGPTTEEAHAQGYGSGQAVVDDARSYIRTPYGAYGMDCSGFTSAVFADLGVYLPDSPGARYAYGCLRAPRPATWCSSTSPATASRTSA